MIHRLAWRILSSLDGKCLRKLAWNFGVMGGLSVHRFRRRLKRGVVFPPFLHLSITSACNLRCQGCWVDVTAQEPGEIPLDGLHRAINQAKAHGNRYFGILGGEPFMHPGLFELIEAHRECYFQIFTNGQFITPAKAERLRRAGNATPLISLEGLEDVSDERRGRSGVFEHTLAGLRHSVQAGLLTGVATSVCKSNIDELLTHAWIDRLIDLGVHYVWYHGYRVIGPHPAPELALEPEQVRRVRRFVVDLRCEKPIGVVDAYWDAQGKALCPAAVGLTHHVGPWGDIEPCPVIQFAKQRIDDPRGLYETITESAFLRGFRELAQRTTRGCVVLERPAELRAFLESHGAADTTARGTADQELAELTPRRSQHDPALAIPERSWVYRLAKRIGYHDFGAYTGHEHPPPPNPTPSLTPEPEARRVGLPILHQPSGDAQHDWA